MYPQSMFRAKIRNENSKHFLLKIFIFYNFKNLCILHERVFAMTLQRTNMVFLTPTVGYKPAKSCGSKHEVSEITLILIIQRRFEYNLSVRWIIILLYSSSVFVDANSQAR